MGETTRGRNDSGRKGKWAKRLRGERESGRNDPDSYLKANLKTHIQIGDSNSTQTRASRREVMLKECLTEYCSSFKSVFKHVSQPLLTRVHSQVSICHIGIILSKRDNYCSFVSSPRSTSLVRAWARQNTQNDLRAQLRFGSIGYVQSRKLSKRTERRLIKLCGCAG